MKGKSKLHIPCNLIAQYYFKFQYKGEKADKMNKIVHILSQNLLHHFFNIFT